MTGKEIVLPQSLFIFVPSHKRRVGESPEMTNGNNIK